MNNTKIFEDTGLIFPGNNCIPNSENCNNFTKLSELENDVGFITELDLISELDKKQDELISGETLATINGHNLLDGGEIIIGEGGGSVDLSKYLTIENATKLLNNIYDLIYKYHPITYKLNTLVTTVPSPFAEGTSTLITVTGLLIKNSGPINEIVKCIFEVVSEGLPPYRSKEPESNFSYTCTSNKTITFTINALPEDGSEIISKFVKAIAYPVVYNMRASLNPSTISIGETKDIDITSNVYANVNSSVVDATALFKIESEGRVIGSSSAFTKDFTFKDTSVSKAKTYKISVVYDNGSEDSKTIALKLIKPIYIGCAKTYEEVIKPEYKLQPSEKLDSKIYNVTTKLNDYIFILTSEDEPEIKKIVDDNTGFGISMLTNPDGSPSYRIVTIQGVNYRVYQGAEALNNLTWALKITVK